ncbi:MAG: carbon monoxide dehydrogenase, partial [Chloroflexota bacterium]
MPKKTIDPATLALLRLAEEKGIPTAFSRSDVIRPCPIGADGNCCRFCFMGPCRLVGKTTTGVCGATLKTVQARNFLRSVAAGSASHCDHGRNLCYTLLAVGKGVAPDYYIKDEKKLRKVAGYLEVETEGRSVTEIATDVARKALAEYGKQDGELLYLKRAPAKRQEIWRQLGIAPRSLDRESVEAFHRTTMGVDQEAEHILLHALRVCLADGWGGSMMATDISDILFGTPTPRLGMSNVGVLKEDEVNILVHGHEPTLAETLIDVVKEPEIIKKAQAKGAKGINLAGMCCSGNEILMRHGIPIAGNFLQSDLIMAT